ncbi:hypothetical protein D3C71_1369620 [compost metagenome]
MCAQRRQIAKQGVGQRQKAKATIQIAARITGLAQHVRQGDGQCDVGVVHVAAGDAVGQVVTHAAAVLAEHGVQVGGAGGDHLCHHAMQATALPVGQDQQRGDGGDGAADQRVQQARPDQHEAVAQQVEAHQRHHRDRGSREQVAVGAVEEEHQCGGQRHQQLQMGAGEQLHQRPRRAQAHQCAGDTLDQPPPGGAEMRATHEQDGQQNPVAVLRVHQLEHDIAGNQRHRDAHAVAEQQRARGQ